MEPDHCVNLSALSFALRGMVHEPGLNLFSHFERKKKNIPNIPKFRIFYSSTACLVCRWRGFEYWRNWLHISCQGSKMDSLKLQKNSILLSNFYWHDHKMLLSGKISQKNLANFIAVLRR